MSPPPNLSWVIPGVLAACGLPSTEEHIRYLEGEGVRHIVSLTETVPPVITLSTGMTSHHIPIPDFTPPENKQVDNFIQLVDQAKDQNKPVVVHCKLGNGRTGTMIACYFLKEYNLSPKEAILKIRNLRPGSIETKDQEIFVYAYAAYINHTV